MKFTNSRLLPRALRVLLAISLTAMLLTGCLSIPDEVLVVVGSGGVPQERTSSVCGSLPAADLGTGVDPDGFSILSWNSQKGSHPDWDDDLGTYMADVDFVLLQETSLDTGLLQRLKEQESQWLLAVAFELAEKEIGVMTAGHVSATEYCAFRENEPVIKVPKMILAARYPIKDREDELLIVNAHIVNFTIGSDRVRRQVEAVKEKIQSHDGPVIVAGDFNTWSGERKAVIREGLEELGLKPVTFEPDHRSEFFGRVVDGVFYRDLEIVQSRSFVSQSSDHNPLEVHFRLTGETH
jgi:endonuclease/exonuclease/phosphatase (EEP) superfamily protein YafD